MNTCQLGKDQLVIVCTVVGNHAKFTAIILKDFIKLIDLNHSITSRAIREPLQELYPKVNM